MSPEESLALMRIIRAACPAQKLDEYTIDVWADALRDVDFGQARAAVRRLVKRQPFIAVSEVVADIALQRREAYRALRDRETFRVLEAAKAASSTEEAEAARRECRTAFDRAIAAATPSSLDSRKATA